MAEIPALGLSVVLNLDVYAAKESGYNKSEKKSQFKKFNYWIDRGGGCEPFYVQKIKDRMMSDQSAC